MKNHQDIERFSLAVVDPTGGHCLVGSLMEVIASQNVTEAHKGPLTLYTNQRLSAKA